MIAPLHGEDWPNVLRGAAAPLVFFFPYYANGFFAEAPLLYTLVIWLLLSDINHVLHVHVHCPFFKNRIANRVLDYTMGIVTGMTASNWRIQHVYGHHDSAVGDYVPMHGWEGRAYTPWGSLCYPVRSIWPIFSRPLTESFAKGVRAHLVAPLDYRYAFAEQLGFLLIVAALTVYQPWLTLTYLLPWYSLVYFVTRYTDYLNHVGCDVSNYGHSNNTTHARYNQGQRNFGYHTAHHHAPAAHWTRLPELHDKIKDKIPADRIKSYSWSGYYLPYHWYLWLRNRM
jgi:fatty acid desaturase